MFVDFFDPQTRRFFDFWSRSYSFPYLVLGIDVERDIGAFGSSPYITEMIWEHYPRLIPENSQLAVAHWPALVHQSTGRIFGVGFGNYGIALKIIAEEVSAEYHSDIESTDPNHHSFHDHNGRPYDFREIGPDWFFIDGAKRGLAEGLLQTWESLGTKVVPSEKEIESTVCWFQNHCMSTIPLAIQYQSNKDLEKYQPLIGQLESSGLQVTLEEEVVYDPIKMICIRDIHKKLKWEKETNCASDCIFVPILSPEQVCQVLSEDLQPEEGEKRYLFKTESFSTDGGALLIFHTKTSWHDFLEVMEIFRYHDTLQQANAITIGWYYSSGLRETVYLEPIPEDCQWIGVTESNKKFSLADGGGICEADHAVSFRSRIHCDIKHGMLLDIHLNASELEFNTDCKVTHPKEFDFRRGLPASRMDD